MAKEVKARVVEESEVPATLAASKALVPIREREMAFFEQAKPVAKIRTQADRVLVATLQATNKDLQKLIHEELDPLCASAHETWQLNLKLRKKHLDPLEAEAARCQRMLTEDNAEQERVAEEKRKKLQAEADAKAEKERKEQVKSLKTGGQPEAAAALAAAPVQAAPVQVENRAAAASAAAGLTFKIQKHMEVVDESLLERKYLEPNMSAIQAAGVAYWEQIKPKDPKDALEYGQAAAKFAAWAGVKGVRFWVTKESADTGRRG